MVSARYDLGDQAGQAADIGELEAAVPDVGAGHLRHHGAGKAELCGFLETGRALRHRPHRARQRNLAEIDRVRRQWRAGKRGNRVPRLCKIGRRFLDAQTPGDVEIDEKHVEITDEVLTELVQAYTKEAGVRNLERELANIMRKVARSVAEGRKRRTVVDLKKLQEYLGPPRFEYGELEAEDQTGSATGLVVTEVGGDVVAVEVTKMEGKEEFILTGQLGDVMRESARAALSWIRTHADVFGIDAERFEKSDIHIHVPAGAIPKDGPSAGVAMFMALTSLMTERTVRNDTAMTGEISLRGLVLPVGGIKEKVVAAHRAGVTRVMLPARNRKDYDDIPEEARKGLEFIWLERVDDAVAAGARVLAGGRADGPCYQATLVTDVPADSDLARFETFGPVAMVTVVPDADAAVAAANDTAYGLSAGIITGDADRGLALAERLRSGIVHINDQTIGDEPQMPFGGVRDSGWGRFGGTAALDEFTELRWFTVQSGSHPYPF